MATPVETAIQDNATGPKNATGDSGSITQHSLKDQMEADRYLAGKNAMKKKNKGMRLMKISPSGTV